jgi:hypothetical protein
MHLTKFLFIAVFSFFSMNLIAQLKANTECNAITVDVYKGWINQAGPNIDPEQIKAKLPCFTRFEKEGNESKCGGGIYYDDKDFKYLIQREYIVIGENLRANSIFLCWVQNVMTYFYGLAIPN